MVVQVGKSCFWVVNDIRIMQKKDGSFWLIFDDRMIELSLNQVRSFGFDSLDFFPNFVSLSIEEEENVCR